MTLSTGCTGKAVLASLGVLLLVSSCAPARRNAIGPRPASPPLAVLSLSPDRPAPQAAGRTPITGSASATGGAGGRRFVYTASIAVLPVENLGGAAAPLETIRESLVESLTARGFNILDETLLEEFMARHRVRYTGGIDGVTAKAFREETGAEAVLLTSVELFDDKLPPKISILSRLVSTEEDPVILWMDGVGMAGDDSPGFLDLGLIEDSRVLLGKAVRSLSEHLEESLSKENAMDSAGGTRNKFRPKISYRSPAVDPEAPHTLAVLPFFNQSRRKHAGEIMKLHVVEEMTRQENLKVIEPGVVRKELLNYRMILEDGLSLAQADVMGEVLNADLLLTGKVLDYQDYQGPEGAPVVDFSLVLIDRRSREVVWASKSFNRGTDGVYFFDWGRDRTAHAMSSGMARIVGEMMWRE